jgi:hypothetical protein
MTKSGMKVSLVREISDADEVMETGLSATDCRESSSMWSDDDNDYSGDDKSDADYRQARLTRSKLLCFVAAGLLIFATSLSLIGFVRQEHLGESSIHDPVEENQIRNMTKENDWGSFRRGPSRLETQPIFLSLPDYNAAQPPLYEFYVYRAQSEKTYNLENVNVANIGGVMWYLGNEIVPDNCQRRFDIRRILRFKLRVRTTPELWAKQMSFGVRYAFDSGECTGPHECKRTWDEYGYVVGCNNLGSFPFPAYETFYPDGIWYSLPGSCPSQEFSKRRPNCAQAEPGGKCEGEPTGERNCTWSVEPAGEIDIDELVGIRDKYHSHDNFCRRGCLEYTRRSASGTCGIDFWNGKWNREANKKRVQKALEMFQLKYPDMPAVLPEPRCDFDNRRMFPPTGLQ